MPDFGNFKNLTNVCYAFMFGGVIIAIITLLIVLTNGKYNPNLLIGNISGYGAIMTGILGLICVFMMNSSNLNVNKSFNMLYDNIAVIVQFILIIIILFFSISINIIFFDKISKNNVNDSYKWLLFVSILLLFAQFTILVNLITSFYTNNINTNTKNLLSNNVKVMVSLFISIINMVALVSATSNLIFFTTDG